MKICVTGGAGFIGAHACKALASAGHEVYVYDNLSTGHREFVKWGDFAHGDTRDTQRFRECLKKWRPDGVIHFAASSQVGESVRDPGAYFGNNVGGALSVLEAMRLENVGAIVVSGTAAVYGQPERIPIREDSPTRPINPYGASKLFMERMLEDFEIAYGLKWTSLRYFNAAGASPEGEIGELHDPESHLIPRVIGAALGQYPEVAVFGKDYPTPDGACVRDYIHVDDLARAHVLALERLLAGENSVALNLGAEKGVSVLEIIAGVQKLSPTPIPVREGPRRAGDPAILVADASRAREKLGWRPEKSLNDIITDAWNFFSSRAAPARRASA